MKPTNCDNCGSADVTVLNVFDNVLEEIAVYGVRGMLVECNQCWACWDEYDHE